MLGIVTSARLDVLILSVVLAPSPIQKSSGRGTGAWQGERFSHHGKRVVPTRYGWDSEALAQRVCPWSRGPSERETHIEAPQRYGQASIGSTRPPGSHGRWERRRSDGNDPTVEIDRALGGRPRASTCRSPVDCNKSSLRSHVEALCEGRHCLRSLSR